MSLDLIRSADDRKDVDAEFGMRRLERFAVLTAVVIVGLLFLAIVGVALADRNPAAVAVSLAIAVACWYPAS